MKPSVKLDATRDLSAAPSPSPAPAVANRWRVMLIIVGLLATTVTAYWGVGRCGFVNLDDDAYVEFQPMVNQGLRPAAIVWALTAVHSSNWHPLTTLSHQLDCELFGVSAAPMHWENLLWHLINAVLVFLVWRTLTGATWRSAFVAGLFALHPLHIESVAWISERKDVLHTFFWLLGIGAYCRYVRRPSVSRYAGVALALILALLAKPMAVTFPCTLLLLDLWPLQRWPTKNWFTLLKEKLPLFGLVLAHSVATYLVQHSSGAADFGQRFTLRERLGNALVAYVRYLAKTVWPESLSPFYPHPGHWPLWVVAGATAVLLTISLLIWKFHRPRGWLAFGWLWFLGTLVPVIGLVQVGAQSIADRYTYVPLLGIFTLVAWSAAEAVAHRPKLGLPVIVTAVFLLGGCWSITRRQVPAWENSLGLYAHTIKGGQDNATIRYLLALATQAAGRPEDEVVAHYRAALKFQPDYINAYAQLSILALRHQQYDEAWKFVEVTLRLEPRNPTVRRNAAAVELWRQHIPEAISHLQDALRLNPAYADGHHDLARIYVGQKRLEETRVELEIVLRLTPWDWIAHHELGLLLANVNRLDEARSSLERALWINPAFEPARRDLAALVQLQRATSPKP